MRTRLLAFRLCAVLGAALVAGMAVGSPYPMRDSDPAADALVPGYFGEHAIVAVDALHNTASGSYLGPDCRFQFALSLHPASVDHVHSGPAYVGIAWVPGHSEESVPFTILSIARNGYLDQISFLFDNGVLARTRCNYRLTADVRDYLGATPQRVALTRRRAPLFLQESGGFRKVDTLRRDQAVLVYIPQPGEVKPPAGYVRTPSGYLLQKDLYPSIGPDGLPGSSH